MYNETFKIIVVLVLTVGAGRLKAQDAALKPFPDAHSIMTIPEYDIKAWLNKTTGAGVKNSFHEKLMVEKQVPIVYPSVSPPVFISQQNHSAGPAIRQDLYVRNFGFFCRKELQVEKATRLPLRFRLGSLAQCNMLEQKY